MKESRDGEVKKEGRWRRADEGNGRGMEEG
jgi:hypothetical protein